LQLSAENFKLKEELSREKYANEMNRKTIIAEVEEKVDRAAVFANAAHARREVLQQEILESGILSTTTLPKHAPGIRSKLCMLIRLTLRTIHGSLAMSLGCFLL